MIRKHLAAFLAGLFVASSVALSAQTGIMSTTTGVVYVRSITGVTLNNSTFTGQSKFADGTAAAPSITFASDTDTGRYSDGANSFIESLGGVARVRQTTASINLANTHLFGWTSGAVDGTGLDTVLLRDAANTLALRNGAAQQFFRIGQASHYLTISKDAGLNYADISTFSTAPLGFGTDNTRRWALSASGHLEALGDYKIATGAGTAAAPGITFASSPSTGFFFAQAGSTVGLSMGGTVTHRYSSNSYELLSDNATIYLGSAFDTSAARAAARVLALGPTTGVRLNWATADKLVTSDFAGDNPFAIAHADWGTTLSAEGVSYANDEVRSIGAGGGFLSITISEDSQTCLAVVRAGGAGVRLIDSASGLCTVTATTGSAVNVYGSGGVTYIENKRGGTRTIKALVEG